MNQRSQITKNKCIYTGWTKIWIDSDQRLSLSRWSVQSDLAFSERFEFQYSHHAWRMKFDPNSLHRFSGDWFFVSKLSLPSTEKKWLRSKDKSQMIDHFLAFLKDLNHQRRVASDWLPLRWSFHTDFRVCSKFTSPYVVISWVFIFSVICLP